ncbi:Alpha/beta hydrolase fold-1 [Podospora aff. communis PSN243]|uniref:Alpha/beta hydrolase fold-1 n=1 Tax=Podospora aff. communis PSN243 TaxID=3040156 RepID=A0AAV9GNY5_9PEZI|nr:Alpha/beta hydrolase fold-1 [Podospora aff. communis PSN243]
MPPKPIIVVIPGAFHKPSHHAGIITPLQYQGYPVLCVSLAVCGDADVSPEATPADDVRALHAQLLPLLDAGHEAVIVAHSYGSMVATASIHGQTKAERSSRELAGGVVGAIWMAGFAFPVRGRNIAGAEEEAKPMPYHVLKDGLISLTEDAKPLFYSDVPTKVADTAWASLCKFQSFKSLNTFPQFLESEITVPKLYVLNERDQAVPFEFQEAMAQVGKFDKVVRLDSGHSPFLSVPEKVVEAIIKFSVEVSGRKGVE